MNYFVKKKKKKLWDIKRYNMENDLDNHLTIRILSNTTS